MKKILLVTCASFALSACANPSQKHYMASEVGQIKTTSFGTVVNIEPITIQGENTGSGEAIGAVAGGLGGAAFGDGTGQLMAAIGGALAGAIAGAVTEQAISNTTGFDITVTLENGETITAAQYFDEKDEFINVGDRVMVQRQGTYMRVLPANDLPEQIKRPKKIEVID